MALLSILGIFPATPLWSSTNPELIRGICYWSSITCAGLMALYLFLFAVISKAFGTISIPDRTCEIVGSVVTLFI